MAQSLAQRLWMARITGAKLPSDLDGAPTTEAQAYRIQSETAEFSGRPVIGWKIGATNESLFPVLGVKKPFLGPLYESFMYSSGDTVPIGPGRALETEISVKLGAGLPARAEPYSRAEIEQCIVCLIPSFEVVGARFQGEFAGAGFKLIADGGANVAMVLGPQITNWADLNLSDIAVSLSVDGQFVAEGNTSVLLWDHVFDAVTWAISQPAIRQRGLLAGDIIMTGTCTGLTPLSGVGKAEVTFDGIGSANAFFAETQG